MKRLKSIALAALLWCVASSVIAQAAQAPITLSSDRFVQQSDQDASQKQLLAQMNLLTGAGGKFKASVAAPVASLSYQTFATESSGGSTVNYSSVAVGGAASNRLIVVIFGTRSGTASTMSAASICGVSATQVPGAAASVASNNVYSDIWYVSDTSSTNCTISGTWSSATTATAIQVDNVVTTTATPSNGANGTNAAGTNSVSATLSVPSNGVGVVGFMNQSPNSPSFTNATLDNNGAITGSRALLAGHTTSFGSINITGNNGTSTGLAISAASWGP